MREVAWATLFLAILVSGCAGGMWLQNRLKEHHKSRETVESVRMVVNMVVTFAALVLGLLVTSAKQDFDDHNAVYRKYGVSLVELDQRLRDYGAPAEFIRRQLRSYTAAVLADTWPAEQRPAGSYPTHLHSVNPGSDETAEFTTMLVQMDNAIQGLSPSDPYRQKIASILQDDVKQVEAERWTLVEGTPSKLSSIFVTILMSWLLIVFVIFGIVSPRNILAFIIIGLSAIAISSSLYLILDLDTSIGGFITVSSQPIRDALWHMDHEGQLY